GFSSRRLCESLAASPCTGVRMFLGAIPRRPSKEAAYKQLRSHLIVMASCVAVIRAAPYILYFLNRDADVLDLKMQL
ncbi:hypothetical protein E2562_029117, partial [Oryza meyeriana var. granulata]